jgi:hypothetical protein
VWVHPWDLALRITADGLLRSGRCPGPAEERTALDPWRLVNPNNPNRLSHSITRLRTSRSVQAGTTPQRIDARTAACLCDIAGDPSTGGRSFYEPKMAT